MYFSWYCILIILQIFGRNLFWYAAVFGTITAISRAAVTDELMVLDQEGAMSMVVQHTHYMPKKWRGKENTAGVGLERAAPHGPHEQQSGLLQYGAPEGRQRYVGATEGRSIAG